MKKQAYLLFVFFLFYLPVLAQTQSGKVIYKIKDAENLDEFAKEAGANKDQTESMAQWLENINKGLPYLKYTLTFTKNEARFEAPTQMKSDHGIDVEKTSKFTGGSGVFYTNLQEHIRLHQLHYIDRDWLVERSNDSLNWEITNETKKINGYTVRKAILDFEGSTYIKPQKITAWFAPELPFQLGPMHYVGLPGLILEVQHQNWTFYADKVKLSEKEKNIKRPTKGEHLMYQDFSKKQKKLTEEMKANYRKK